MSISTQTDKIGPFIITGLPQVIPIAMPFQSGSDLIVYDTGSSGTGNDPALTLTLNSDYTVSGGGYDSSNTMQVGSITVAASGANDVQVGDYIVIARNVPINQTTSFQASGPLTIQMVEQALDKMATLSQQVNQLAESALRFPPWEFTDGELLKSARAGYLLGFDADGNVSFSSSSSGGGGTTYTAGAGLLLASNEFSVDPDQTLNSLTVTDPITGDLAGNADTATALETARTINGVSFDGTANITVPASAATLTGTALPNTIVDSSLLTVGLGTLGTMAIQNSTAISATGGTLNGVAVTGLANGTNPTDAVNLSQLQGVSAGIILRTGVVAATTANISLSAPQTIDGQAVIAGNRILVKNQSAPAENGIYVVAAGAWSRATDSDTAAELLVGYTYFVSSGTVNGASTWSINVAPTTINVSPVGFVQFSASQTYSAGTGLSLTGNVFSLNSALSGLVITASAFNGTIGATTPSTAVVTTLQANTSINVSGTLSQVGSAVYFTQNTTRSFTVNRNWQLAVDALAEGHWTLTPSTAIGGSTFATPILDVTTAGLSVTGGNTANLFTRTGTSTNNSVWGVVSDATTYNMLTLNNVATKAGMLGISGGGGSDKVLYSRVATGGGFDWRIADTSIGTIGANGLSIVGGIQGTGIYNVRNYGALGDGSTNDTVAIAAAIAALPASSGATLYFPAGVYLTDAITIASVSNIAVKGDGRTATIVRRRTSGNTICFRSSCSNITMSDLTIDNNNSARTAGQHGIVIGCSNFTINNVGVTRCGEYAVLTGWDQVSGVPTAVTDIIASNIYVYNTYADGFHFANTTRGVLTNSDFVTDDDCIAVDGSSHITVSNCVGTARNDLGTTWGRGVAVFTGSTDVIINGVDISATKQSGLYVELAGGSAPARVTFSNCRVYGAAVLSGYGAYVEDGTDIKFEGGAILNALQGNHLTIAKGTRIIVSGVQLGSTIDAYARGITTADTSGAETIDGFQIVNNTFSFPLANQNDAIRLAKGVSGAYYSNVIIAGNTGIGNASEYLIFTRNMAATSKVYNNTSIASAATYFHDTGGGGSTPANGNNN